jgi:isocitrate dehydrogenase
VFERGLASGVPRETIDSIARNRVALKGPLETPVGHGEKSANVTLRTLFETYANVRPVRGLPGVPTPYSARNIDLVVVRENVEDLYAGIEHMQTPGVAQCLKLISRKGCEKIVQFAFELARAEGRRPGTTRDGVEPGHAGVAGDRRGAARRGGSLALPLRGARRGR